MDDPIHDQPSDIFAEDGAVAVEGPDGVSVLLTPEAAEETGHRLLDGAAAARSTNEEAPSKLARAPHVGGKG
jgi:hypothetical protein